MKIQQMVSLATRVVSRVTLETPEEQALTDAELLLIADNMKGIKYDWRRESYDLVSKDFGPKRHFGGRVERVNNVANVTVNID